MTVIARSGFTKLLPGRESVKFRRIQVAIGLLASVFTILAAGELYLRVAPPGDLAQYLPESDAVGPFRPDAKYGVQYRSFEHLVRDNPGRIDPYQALFNNPEAPPTWAFFGSSFVQAPGMLADTARTCVPQRVIFNLGKNEPLPVRLAQAELLLESGLRPERIFLVLIPLDASIFAQHGLDQYRTTRNGALVYAPRTPPFFGSLLSRSRLALKGWTRTTLHQNLPRFSASSLHEKVDPAIRADVRHLLGSFSETAAKYHVPVTVVLLPNYEQLLRNAKFAAQDAIAEDARAVGVDVCDVRERFLAWPDKAQLLIPDKHFSDLGNRLLLAAILEHLKLSDSLSSDLPGTVEVQP